MYNSIFNFILVLIFSVHSNNVVAQVTPTESQNIFRRLYNHEVTYEVVVKYICQDVLKVEHNKLVDVSLGTVTSAKSGELTTAVYHSNDLGRQGLVFTFWSDRVTLEMNSRYDGYAFKEFDLNQANSILSRLSQIIEDKKVILDDDNHAVFQYEDVTFIFRDRNTIFVCWSEYRSTWTVPNLKTTITRVNRFLKKKNN